MEQRTILITGGTGSWGTELARQLLRGNPKEIRVFSRNESLQVKMRQAVRDPRLQFRIGDIRDERETSLACQGVDDVYHLAALKHVPVCEEQPDGALKTNVIGTRNVIDAAIENGVRRVLYVSTDKASSPANTYGLTKAIAEKLVLHADSRSSTRFACLRSGNVLGSAGSVVPIFAEQLAKGQDLSVTDPRMTRFFLTLGEAVETLMLAMEHCLGGEIFVTKMPSCKITDLAQVLIDHSGQDGVKLKQIGIRPGEKLHETLITEQESGSVVDRNERYFVLLPASSVGARSCEQFPAAPWSGGYRSEDAVISKTAIAQLLRKGGFL